MTVQPFTMSWTYSKTGHAPEVDEAGLSKLSPKGEDFLRQLKASLKSQTVYSRGAMLTSLSLLAACGGSGGGGGGGVVNPPPANTAPVVGANAAVTTNEDTRADLDFTAPTDADGDALTITVDELPTNGTLFNGATAVAVNDTLTVAEFQGLEFQPNADANGASGQLRYTVDDGNGGDDTQTIGFTIDPVNDAPVVQADKAENTNEDTDLDLGITAPTDVEGDALTISAITAPTNGTILLNGVPVADLSTLTVADLPNLSYRPDADFNGADTFSYTVSDGTDTDTQTIMITVDPVNDAPVAEDDKTENTNEDTDLALAIPLPTDVDMDALTISATTAPTDGTILLSGTPVADLSTLTVADLPNLSYRPNADFNGTDGFTYTVSDGTATDTQTITIVVSAVNDAPVVAANADVTTTEDTRADLNFNAPTDVDGDPLTITVDELPTNGTLFNGAAAVAVSDTLTVAEFQGLEYQPDADAEGASGQLRYTVTDTNAGTDTQTIGFNITPVNDAPDAQDDKSVSADVGTREALTIAAPADPDVGETFTITVTAIPTEGAIVRAGETTALAVNDTITVAELTGLEFLSDPADSVGGAGTFAYSVEDSGGLTDTQTVTLSLTSGNFDLSGGSLNGANGFEVTGVVGTIGESVSGGGDFNNDGIDDIVIANPSGNNVFLIFGGAVTMGTFDPFDGTLVLQAENGQTFAGVFGSTLGAAVDLQRDINGDGIEDLVISAPLRDVGGAVDSGEVYVVFGAPGNGNGGDRSLDGADAPDGTDGVRYDSEIAGALAGSDAKIVGDINNDGFDDLAIGKPGVAGGGEVTIIYGVDGGFASGVITDGGVPGTETDDVLTGARASSEASSNIAGLGDVNGDGIDDFIIGAPDTAPLGSEVGEVFILFGGDGIDFSADLALVGAMGGTAGLRLIGAPDDRAGTVAGGGDFNGDGINDILIGVPGSDGNGADSGAVLLLFGQADGTWDFGTTFDGNTDTITAPDGVVIAGGAAGDGLGSVISSVGDFNGDGIDDFAVTAANDDGGNGSVYLIFGRSDFSGGVDLSTTDSLSHIEITGDDTDFGQSLSSAGNANGDGLADIIIGANDSAFVLYGFSNGAPQAGMAESIIPLDEGIVLPDSPDGGDDTMPLEIADGGGQSGQAASVEPIDGASALDAILTEDIDLSGIA